MRAICKISIKPSALAGCLFGRLIIPLRGFDDQAHTDCLGRNLDPAHFTIYDCPNLLDIGLELTLGDAGSFLTDTAEIFGFTACGDTSAGFRLFA